MKPTKLYNHNPYLDSVHLIWTNVYLRFLPAAAICTSKSDEFNCEFPFESAQLHLEGDLLKMKNSLLSFPYGNE